MQSRGMWPFPVLDAIVETPVLADLGGAILDKPGHHEGLLYIPAREYPAVLAAPTLDDAKKAAAALREPFRGFPFVAEHHWSATLAATLTPVARFAIDGNAPAFGVSAPAAGTGKTLHVDVCSIIATGREGAKMAPADDSKEERKRIFALCLAGDRVALVDNIEHPYGSASLAFMLTSRTFTDRELGLSRTETAPVGGTWYMTGNGLDVRGDLGRRTVRIELDAKAEEPQERSGFEHPNLIAWTRAEHPRLLVAALTILRAYCKAGRPSQGLTPYGSFEEWSDTVRSAVVWLGLPDPLEGAREARETSDPRRQELAALLEAWHARYGDVAQSMAHVRRDLTPDKDHDGRALPQSEHEAALRDALGAFDHRWDGRGMPNLQAAGYQLRKYRGRIVAGYVLEAGPRGKNGAAWTVRKPESRAV